MKELITVNYGNETPTVSGRDLHDKLGIDTQYSHWIERMIDYGLIEGEDFWPFLAKSSGGRPATDHQLSIDMAKQICMIQRNEKGKMYREYFLSIEKKWNTPEWVMNRALKYSEALIDKQKREIAEMKPKAAFADAIENSENCILIGELAKILKQNGVNRGQNRLFDLLRKEGYLIKSGSSRNMPTQRFMEAGLFEIREKTITLPDGSMRVTKTTLVTGRGQQYFINKFLGGDHS